ncbi:MAG: class I SAM-dependent methyltransferase [Acidimicrobiia bacterium]|nr:class I SAM-dependent methyltransferase [Acidimicrobiia bacterium]MBT8194487.1 class I SAM-dependent methyltransferase [Acidimicrobiia bacterium]NNF89240.1 class I SAM-dependent methyltransferase [Acidimicrobiia bacterium]NNJ47752.1 class I SAM-dependent methyltransferase [Acidimicrobiia bacterium]NNL13901.1 class I SAM-dependent methyltransferase [Acidimicrobiia bacterium]
MSWKRRLAAEPGPPDYLERNRAHWDAYAPEWVEMGRRAWAGEPSWGEWGVPDTEFGLLTDVGGMMALEVGCGTGYVSAWLARAGAAPIGLDNSSQQLATAADFQREFDLSFPLIHGAGEHLPFRTESFDLVISEYGAAIWSDPYTWIPEAVRVLRPGGELIFLGNSVLFMLCAPDLDGVPAERTMLRPQFGMHRFEWPDDDSVEFHLSHGDMLRLLRANGLEVLDLIEVQAPEGAPEVRFNASRAWARQWPAEEIWRARKGP